MDAQTADLLADIHKRYPGLVEADINMDSNLITHAYEIVGVDVNAALQETLANRTTNFEGLIGGGGGGSGGGGVWLF